MPMLKENWNAEDLNFNYTCIKLYRLVGTNFPDNKITDRGLFINNLSIIHELFINFNKVITPLWYSRECNAWKRFFEEREIHACLRQTRASDSYQCNKSNSCAIVIEEMQLPKNRCAKLIWMDDRLNNH